MNRAAALLLAAGLAIFLLVEGVEPLTAQNAEVGVEASEARRSLEIARTQQRNARLRAERLEAENVRAEEASSDARREAAALAARVQHAEANVAAAEAELAIVARQRDILHRDLSRRRQPLAQLTAALETLARRPLVLTALRPGSLRDIVHTRAILGSAIPEVQLRTAALRSDLKQARMLTQERHDFLASRKEAEQTLLARRRDMLSLAEKERILARQATGGAAREARRALDLAEDARDLSALVGQLEQTADLRQRLGSLDGPVPKPAQPGGAALPPTNRNFPASSAKAPQDYFLPVAGRIGSGFGEVATNGARRSGIVIAARPQAQIIAPAAGRVAFAGDYEGYGRIVIIEHNRGWTTLLTGLSRLAVTTGQELTAGSPLGLAGTDQPEIVFELRRNGKPVNPLDYVR